MQDIAGPKVATPRMFWIVIVDFAVIWVLSWLVLLHVVSLYLTVLIGFPAIFAASFLVISRTSRRRVGLPR